MKRTNVTGIIALVCVAMGMIGCSAKKNDPMAMNAGAADISAVPPTPAPLAVEPVAEPVAQQPLVSDAPTQAASAAAPVAAPAPGGGTYTVQKGDTLWKIAATSYGDGKQWQKIASANPGLSPSTLKAGQKITIP